MKKINEYLIANRNKEENKKRSSMLKKGMTEEEKIRFERRESAIANGSHTGHISALMTKTSQSKNKLFFRSFEELSEDGQAVFNIIDCFGMTGFSNNELIALCKAVGVPFSGRTKAQLINTLCNWYDEINRHMSGIDNKECFSYGDVSMLEYIATSDLHKVVARSCIKKIASSASSADGAVKFHGYEACAEIVKNGYSDTIVEDIEQDMYIALLDVFKRGYLAIEDGFIKYTEYMSGYTYQIGEDADGRAILRKGRTWEETQKAIEEKGAELVGITRRNVWADFISAVQNTLDAYKGTDAQRAKTGNYVSLVDEDGNERLIGERSTEYLNALVSQCAKEGELDFQCELDAFCGAFSAVYPKQGKRFSREIVFYLAGYTEQETAYIMGISRRTVQLDKALAKSFYHGKYGQTILTPIERESVNRTGCTYRPSDASASGSYGFNYGDALTGESGLYQFPQVNTSEPKAYTAEELRAQKMLDCDKAFYVPQKKPYTRRAVNIRWHNYHRQAGIYQFERGYEF